MSDDLKTRLAEWWEYDHGHLIPEAAARIEALERELAGYKELAQCNAEHAVKIGNRLIARADTAETGLTKAVSALREAQSQLLWCARGRMESKSLQQFPEKWAAQIEATLAEIEGV